MTTEEWPSTVSQVTGMAPGEVRLVSKVTGGVELGELEPADQLKASVFVALLRWYRDHHGGQLPDPNETWDQAEWTSVEPERGTVTPLNPTVTAN